MNKLSYDKKTGPGLVFFCLLLFLSCKRQSDEVTPINLKFEAEKAISLSFVSEEVTKDFKIYVVGNMETSVLGKLNSIGNRHTFTPIIPFSTGQTYHLYNGNHLLAEFTIESSDYSKKPELLAIYPSLDTVPENLLKMYFVFSKPMQEVGSALDFIKITNNRNSTELEVFLELQSELWNTDHSRLTLWLDPGRIKTDLIPNKEKGLPIIKGNAYTLTISANWRDANGTALDKSYSKQFHVEDRDTKKPGIHEWDISAPKAGSLDALAIDFKEPLDALLLLEMIKILNSDHNTIEGHFELMDKERQLKFSPVRQWSKGLYRIEIDSRLEDLAGNNLNHLFDVDLKATSAPIESSESKSILFEVE